VLGWGNPTFVELLQHGWDDHAQLLEELFACGRHGGLIGHRYRRKAGQLRGQWRLKGRRNGSEKDVVVSASRPTCF